jgi:cell division protein FtsX
VATAVAATVAALVLMRADALRTAELLAEREQAVADATAAREAEVERAGRELEAAMRDITKNLGFNILILSAEQDLDELHVEQAPSKTFPESYVDRLAKAPLLTINHLLPMVTARIDGESLGPRILLVGTRGEVPQSHVVPKQPLRQPVPAGSIVLGHRLHAPRGLRKGDTVELRGRKFVVHETYDERGTADDVTAWIPLGEAQEMLGLQNLLHAVLALECNCATVDRVAEVRAEVAKILPGVQVLERGPPALARAEARKEAQLAAATALARARTEGRAALTRDRNDRAALRRQRESFAAILVPLVVAAAGLGIAFLISANVRQRQAEIGLLRALGWRSVRILQLVLGKALVLALCGAVVGWIVGFGAGVACSELSVDRQSVQRLFAPESFAAALLLAPFLAVVAGWIPALAAARRDPASILQAE